MLQYLCSDVFSGCDRKFMGLDDAGIIDRVSEHAVAAHGATEGADLAEQIRGAIRPA